MLLLAVGVGVWWIKRTPVAPAPQPLPAPVAPTNQIVTPKPTPPVATPMPVAELPPTNVVALPRTNVPAPIAKPVTNTPPDSVSGFPRSPRDVLEAQIALGRQMISSGSLDGVMGSQTRAALLAFQRQAGLPDTGELDSATRAALVLEAAPLMSYVVTAGDLARLQPLSKTWLGKSQQTALDYESVLELVAEKGHASPNLVRRLNPGVNWSNVVAGTMVRIPDETHAPPATKAAFAVISLGTKQLEVFDGQTNLLAHFPCSIAARVDKRPVGELHVTAIAPNPDYTFNPEVFPESPEAQQIKSKLILPPGPNNPVGTAWISLDKPGYGMHGTPSPEQVGRTESHGCFRLANWNAEYLVKRVWIGMPVYVEP